MSNKPVVMLTRILAIRETIVESVRKIAPIARQTLQLSRTHSPTAILHTISGFYPIVMYYENSEQKKAVVEYVKKEARERHAYAVTTITNNTIVDCRSGEGEEALVLATSIRGCQPYIVMQKYARNMLGAVASFYEMIEGEEAVAPGQMLIFPEWDQEISL
ncbi:MAG: hypothetical protein V1897_02640 [Pseudomonadota bacterium]